MRDRSPEPGAGRRLRSTPGARRRRRLAGTGAVLLLAAAAAHAAWPVIWDYDGRSDQPVAAALAPGGDLVVLVEAWAQGASAPCGVLLRIGPDGQVAWATPDCELTGPTGLALAGDGRALALSRVGGNLRVTAFTATGAIDWSRTRAGLVPETPFMGPAAQPVWDAAAAAWRIPAGLGSDFAVLSWNAVGDPLPDLLWTPPAGDAVATAVAPRPGGGVVVSGWVDLTVPGWWVVALDAAGVEAWRRFEDGGTAAGLFSGAFPVAVDAARVTMWADDETGCGLFSLRLWSLDAATGAPLWATTWPDPPACDYFIPDVVRLAGDRILAAGATTVFGGAASPTTAAVSFDAADLQPVWAREFAGTTNTIRAEVASAGGAALSASTLFPPVNPGPTPLWTAAWSRDGVACGAPVELLPAYVAASFADAAGRWLLVGYGAPGTTGSDLLVQLVADPCTALFRDGFESGDVSAWSSSVP